MIADTGASTSLGPDGALAPDFTRRLEGALAAADAERRRRSRFRLAARVVPLALLVGPVVGWRLTSASPGDAHKLVDAAAWVTFVLDVGVHINTNILSFLGLELLPSVVGLLLFTLLTIHLLTSPGEKR